MALTDETLAALRAKNQPTETTETKPTETEAAPEAQKVENTTEEVEQTEATTDEKVANPETETKETEEVEEVNWDEPETKVETTKEEDFSWVSDLELGEIKSRDEFKTAVKDLKSKLKTLEDKPLEGLPDDFKQMIEVAKTGDWKDYLASQIIDYTKLDPVEEFERDFIQRNHNNPKYFTEGKYDHQKLLEAVDALPDSIRELEGSRIIQAQTELAERQRVAIKAKAEAKRNEAEKSLAQSTRQLGELLPLETYGIKFEPRHSSEIYEGIVNSKLTKKHLGMSYDDLVRSGADMKAITRSITLAEKGEKMLAFKAKNSETKAKKDILKTTQNIQLNTSGTNPTPEDPENKVQTAADKVREYKMQTSRGLN